MPKDTYAINSFSGMTPSAKAGGVFPLIQGARIDISPNLVQEFDDVLDTGTVYTDHKTMTVNGVEHTIGITTAGKIVVDGVPYNGLGTDNVGNAKIDVFNNCALIIDPNNNNVPAKIVTFPENVADSIILSDTDTIIVEDDKMYSYGSLSDIKKFIVLNEYMALVLFSGATKLCFFILKDIGTSYDAGDIIDCAEHTHPIIDFAPHYVLTDVDYAVFAYYNDGRTLCFGKYDIASWFPTFGSYTHTSFTPFEVPPDISSKFLSCGDIPVPNGWDFTAMAVTKDRLYWQYLGENNSVGGDVGGITIEEDEDILFSILLSSFVNLMPGNNTIDSYENGWTATSVQKSKLPIKPITSLSPWGNLDTIWIMPGIAILEYDLNNVGICISLSDVYNLYYHSPHYHCICIWRGEQPYYGSVGTPYIIDETTKWFDALAPNHSYGSHAQDNCRRSITRLNVLVTQYSSQCMFANGYLNRCTNIYGILSDEFVQFNIIDIDSSYDTSYFGRWRLGAFTESDYTAYSIVVDLIGNMTPNPIYSSTNNLKTVSMSPNIADESFWVYDNKQISNVAFNYVTHANVTIDTSDIITSVTTGEDFIKPTLTEEDSVTSVGMAFNDGGVRYAYSFIYDGYQESPLSADKYDTTFDNTAIIADDYFSSSVKITIPRSILNVFSKRITGMNVYASRIKDGAETDLYRLVQYVPFNIYEMAINEDGNGYVATISDYGNRLASFDSTAGFSETLDNVSVYRSVQCAYQGYVFVGNIHITTTDKKISLDNIIVRSLPFQPSVFDYASNFAVLPFTATAMAGYNNRLYVFGKEDYAVINPDTMGIEYKSDALGCESYKFLAVTEFGIFVFFNDNIYAIDGANIMPIGNDIKISLYSSAPSLETMGVISIHYFKKRNALCVIGEDYAYLYSIPTKRWMLYNIPQIGITTPPREVFASYDDEGDIHICYAPVIPTDPFKSITKQSQTLFGNTTLRDIEVEQVINFGDDISKKRIYDTEILPAVNGDVVEYDNITAEYPLEDIRNTVLYVNRSAGNIDGITLTYRKFVVKEY